MASTTYVDSVTISSDSEWNKWDTAAYAALTGVAGTNTITATGPANLGLVATNPVLWLIPAVTNTGATTLAITPSGGAALTTKNIFSGGAACVGGELVAGVPAALVYDGTQYQILGAPQRSGTWTPFIGGTATYTNQLGTYTKVGRLVHVTGRLTINALGTGSTTTVSGLPFTVKNGIDSSFAVSYFNSLAIACTSVMVAALTNNTQFTFSITAAAVTGATATAAILGNGADIIFAGTYEV